MSRSTKDNGRATLPSLPMNLRVLLLALLTLPGLAPAGEPLTAEEQQRLEAWRKQGVAAVPRMLGALVCQPEPGALGDAVLTEWARMGAPAVAALLQAGSRPGCEEGPNTDGVLAELACRMPGDGKRLRASLAPLLARPLDVSRLHVLAPTARCLEGRLCGPDEATLDATLRKCCGEVYPGRGPGWCPR